MKTPDVREKGQTRDQKIGEIRYREKLVEQQVLNTAKYFDDHPAQLEDLIQRWVTPQLDDLRRIIGSSGIDKSAKILEIGCENGHCSSFLANQGYFVLGIDISLASLKSGAPIVNSRLGFQIFPHFVNGDITVLPFQEESFDMVFCFSCLHHFPNLDEPIAEICRVLKDGGVFFCTWEPMRSLAHSFKPLYDRVKGITPPSETEYNIFEGQYSYFRWVASFRRGFEMEQVNVRARWLPRTGFDLIDRLFALLTGFSIEIVCKRRAARNH
jgi:SAM-dependent methyltransferase